MAGEVMKVLIVDDIPETREMLRKLLAFETDIEVVAVAATGREAITLTHEFKPDIVLMDINMPDMDGITATEEIKKIHPAVGVIIMSVQSEAEYLRRAMKAGARDFVTKPISGENLYEAIQRVYGIQEEEREKAILLKQAIVGGASIPPTTKAAGHIIAVYSPQGGAGVTSIATSMAISLLHEGKRVVLIDADLQWGDIGVFLNLTSKYTISNLADAITELDQALIENVMISHDSGLKVLLAPYHIDEAERISPAAFAAIIKQIARYFDYVIIDMPKRLDEIALSILDSAARIIMVATPTLPSIKSTRIALNLFLTLNYPPEKIFFVLNRVNSDAQGRASIPIDAIENNLKRTIDARIPLDEHTFLSAVNRGVSVVAIDAGKSPAIDLIRFADKVHRSLGGIVVEEAAPATPSSRSRLSGILGGFGGDR